MILPNGVGESVEGVADNAEDLFDADVDKRGGEDVSDGPAHGGSLKTGAAQVGHAVRTPRDALSVAR